MVPSATSNSESAAAFGRGGGLLELLRLVCASVGLSSLLIAIPCLVGVWTYGSVARAILAVRGEPILVANGRCNVGRITSNTEFHVVFELANLYKVPTTIVGLSTSCDCITTSSIPLALAPRAMTPIRFKVEAPSRPGSFSRAVRLYTDRRLQPEIILILEGVVIPARRPSQPVAASTNDQVASLVHSSHEASGRR